MAYKNVFQADDETLFRTLIAAKDLGALSWFMPKMEMSLTS